MAGGRPSGPKTRNNGNWTESKWRSFIKNQLRGATRKWPPISQCMKDARTSRGVYRCAGCQEDVPASIKVDRKKVKNVFVDHINPVVNPEVGWEGWESIVEGLFCEGDNLQVLCLSCHSKKSNEERQIATARRRLEKEQNIED